MSATRQNPRLARSVSAAVEALEVRAMMSVTIQQISDSSGNLGLLIRGNSASDTVLIVDDFSSGMTTVTANGNVTNYNNREIFDVDLGGGNDSLTYRLQDELDGGQRSLHLDGGTGNDSILLDIENGLRNNADIDIIIDGDTGNDTITADLYSYTYDSKIDLDIIAGEGNDTVDLTTPAFLEGDVNSPNYASVAIIDIDLGAGRNTLTTDISSVYYDSTLDIDIKGGNSTGSNFDTVNIDANDYVQGKLFIDVSLLAGDDRLNITMEEFLYVDPYGFQTGTPTARLNLNGGDGNDRMSFVSEYLYVDATSYFSLKMNGGNGNDILTVDMDQEIEVAAGGQLLINVDGQNGNDTINAAFTFTENAVVGPGFVDIALKGGQQSDRFNVFVQDLTVSGVNFFNGTILVDGQSNTDTLDILPGADDTFVDVRNIENVLA